MLISTRMTGMKMQSLISATLKIKNEDSLVNKQMQCDKDNSGDMYRIL